MAKRKVEVMVEPVPAHRSLPLNKVAFLLAFVLIVLSFGVAFVELGLGSDKADKLETNLGYVQNDVSALEGKVSAIEATQSEILGSLLDSKSSPVKYRPALHRRKHRR